MAVSTPLETAAQSATRPHPIKRPNAERIESAEIPMLDVRRAGSRVDGKDSGRLHKRVWPWILVARVRIPEVDARPAVLVELRPRKGAYRALRCYAGTVLELVVEDAIAGADCPAPVALGIPREPEPRRERVVALGDAGAHSRISREQQPL